MLEKATAIIGTEIKAPLGSVNEKYVQTCVMVKVRINLGSFGLF